MKYFKPLTLYQYLLKLHPSKRGRLLGLSVGNDAVFSKCVGVAVSDSNNEVASPVSVMERKKDNIYQMASALEDLVKDLSVSAVIVGYRKDPWDLKKISKKAIIGLPKDPWDNTELFKFLEDLYKAGKFQQVPYTYWEEEDLFYQRVSCMVNPFVFDRRLAKMLRDKKYCASEMLQVALLMIFAAKPVEVFISNFVLAENN
ncbi:hypothetical protein CTI12_AA010110 [Artemisia annua]|uniref:Uncharacterized protein n=1 Tax=Artemisia annua TaxID=35608 RepID=A0A2U1QMV4_ARTAN|nr:hypothetical protein CTI12_AA010110 [Artemisia annua]